MTHKYSLLVACALMAIGVITIPQIIALERADGRPDLSGRWELNRDLSEDASAKLKSMHSSEQPAGGHGPGVTEGWVASSAASSVEDKRRTLSWKKSS